MFKRNGCVAATFLTAMAIVLLAACSDDDKPAPSPDTGTSTSDAGTFDADGMAPRPDATGADAVANSSERDGGGVASLELQMVHPTGSECKTRVEATLEDTPMQIEIQARGLRPASPETPVIVSWGFLLEDWQLELGGGSVAGFTDLPAQGEITLQREIVRGGAAAIGGGDETQFLVTVGKRELGRRWVRSLRTLKKLSAADALDAKTVVVRVSATDARGTVAQRTIALRIHPHATLDYDGNVELVEQMAPVQVSQCMAGGDEGLAVTYVEDEPEIRNRSLNINYTLLPGTTPQTPFSVDIDYSAAFGVDVNAAVSSTQAPGLNISGWVPPGEYGVFYRQTQRLNRTGKVIRHTVCGGTEALGRAVVTDWTFTPELAVGPECVPPSNLGPRK